MRLRLPQCALLGAFLLTLATHAAAAEKLRAGEFSPPRMAPEIAQQAADGSAFRLSALRGKVVVLAFGFTHCPQICPTTLALLADARQKLGARAKDMQVVFASVDPERDLAPRMHEYLGNFDRSFIGLTGTPAQMAAIRKDYGITATKNFMPGSKTDYMVGHSSYLYFIDKKGSLRALMPFGRPAEDVVHDVILLAGE